MTTRQETAMYRVMVKHHITGWEWYDLVRYADMSKARKIAHAVRVDLGQPIEQCRLPWATDVKVVAE
jgi:hypothetical protein